MLIGWIVAFLDRIVAKSIMYYNNAIEISHDKSSSAQLYSLQEHTNLNQNASMTIADYFTRVKSRWDVINHLDPLPMYTCQPIQSASH